MPLKPPKKKSGIKLYVLIFFLFPFFISMDDIYISWCWKKMAFVTKQNSKS